MEPTQKKRTTITVLAILAGIVLLIVIFSSAVTISEGHMGVKYQFGRIVNDQLNPGLHFKIPFIENVTMIDIREQTYDMDTTAYTKDTQTVENLRIKLNYFYDKGSLSDIVRNVGIQNVESKLIIPQMQSIVKNEIGQFRAEELIQNRSKIQSNIQDKMSESLSKNGIIVAAFAIENIDFENGFEEAVRAKVVAEQDALKMQNKTKERQEEAKQMVIAAEAQAESQRIKADAEAYAIEVVQEQLDRSPQYIELEKVKKWNGQFPQVLSDGVNPFVSISGNPYTIPASTGATGD